MTGFYQADHGPCPTCGDRLTACTPGTRQPAGAPEPGDLTVCARCGVLLMFDGACRVRHLEPAELDRLTPTDLTRVSEARTLADARPRAAPTN